MCARFVFVNGRAVRDQFGAVPLPGLSDFEEYPGSFNLAPTDPVVAIAIREGIRGASFYQWGLVPSWANDPSIGQKLINARSETVAEKPSFRGAFKYRRCLIPADGFYEWRGSKGNKQPFYIHQPEGRVMAFAGLYETWERMEGYLETVTILTTEANREMRELHDRMPVVLDQRDWDMWLDPSLREPTRLLPLLRPLADGSLEMYPVGVAVGNPRNEGAELIARTSTGSLFD